MGKISETILLIVNGGKRDEIPKAEDQSLSDSRDCLSCKTVRMCAFTVMSAYIFHSTQYPKIVYHGWKRSTFRIVGFGMSAVTAGLACFTLVDLVKYYIKSDSESRTVK